MREDRLSELMGDVIVDVKQERITREMLLKTLHAMRSCVESIEESKDFFEQQCIMAIDAAKSCIEQNQILRDIVNEKDMLLQQCLPPADPEFEAFVAEQAKINGIEVIDGNKYPREFIFQMHALYFNTPEDVN